MSDNKTYTDRTFNNQRRKAKIEQEEKELEALMKKQTGEEPEEEEEQEEETQETPTTETEEPEPTDPEEKTFKKRYGDLRRHMQQKEKEWEERFKQLESKDSQIMPPASNESIEAWAKKYPQVAGIVNTIAKKQAEEMFKQAESRFKQLDELQEETTRKTAIQKIREVHEDFEELKSSDEFHDWAGQQARWVQDALYENMDDPDSVIAVIDLYKYKTGKTKTDKRATTKEAAKSVKTNSSPKPDVEEGTRKVRESEVQKMSDAEFEKNLDKILEAQKTGNFIYDITGGAR